MKKPEVDILVISLSAPLLVGIYQNNRLTEQFTCHEKSSEALPRLMAEILRRYTPQRLCFARGPGSFMAIKITYLFLRTLSISLDIPLLATDGFAFNQNTPIKAAGSLYFSKENGKIATRKIDLEKERLHPFALPQSLEPETFSEESEPLYVLPAV